MEAPKAKMGSRSAQRSLLRAAALIVFAAALFALQTFLGALPQGHVPGSSAKAQIGMHYCDGRGDETPAPDRRKSVHCCILCSSLGDRDAPLHYTLAASPEILSLQPSCASRLSLRVFDARPRAPQGWTSTWSSRAPPLFS